MFCKQLCSQYVPDVARGFPVRYPSSCADDCFSPQVECPSVPFDDQCLRLADRRAYVDEHGEYVFSLVSFAWGVRRTFARSESVGVGGAETCFPCGYRTDRGCFPFSVRFVCRAVLFGGGAVCREARLAGIRALNKYVVGILHYNQTQSPERRKAIVDDALKAMSSPGTRHLLSECKLEHLPWYRTNETFRRETSHWSHVAVREGINFYEKSEPVSCR